MQFLFVLVLSSFVYACSCFSLQPLSQGSSVLIRNRRHQLIEHDEGRSYCAGCNRPPIQCLCDYLPAQKILLDTHVLILQHPVEFRRKTISTVPLIKLTLEFCQVLVGRSFDVQIESIINDACSKDRIPILLFPGPDAICLEDIDAVEQLERAHHTSRNLASKGQKEELNDSESSPYTSDEPKRSKYLLIIVDGTWTQAKRMLRNSPLLLQRCHSIQFTGTTDLSIYGSIRKQPEAFCLSTLESCARTLRLLEPANPQLDQATNHLYESLKALVRVQMEQEQIHLEQHPDCIRDISKLVEKKHRQNKVVGGWQNERIDDLKTKLVELNDNSSKIEMPTASASVDKKRKITQSQIVTPLDL